ncbi:hypothetical protein K435DRAFT_930390 [Dendrothele bispora CBS 962.96]|uniref:Alpha-L-arabinofuranosidase C-terminal domain-containing protein n=1 Tax=Dendrothele bispora (strain CBS 962.96) TaxID=1314807 RepID=A0A4S8L597_DENBC|nr:hypothetical protein K435DRAFT_930390 [Dendrothele bispora CBS 962.96]
MASSYVNNPVLGPNGMFMFILTLYMQSILMFSVMEHSALSENYAISTNSDVWASTGRLQSLTVQGAVSETAFMTGLERNSDIVFAAAYAPLLNANVSLRACNGRPILPALRTLSWAVLSKQTNSIIEFSYNAPANSVRILTFVINGSASGGSTNSGGTGPSGGSTRGSFGGVLKYGQYLWNLLLGLGTRTFLNLFGLGNLMFGGKTIPALHVMLHPDGF